MGGERELEQWSIADRAEELITFEVLLDSLVKPNMYILTAILRSPQGCRTWSVLKNPQDIYGYRVSLRELRVKHPSSSPVRSHSSTPNSGKGFRGARRSPSRDAKIRERNRNLAAWSAVLVLGTVGLSYASVPLYRMFCQVTGFGGTVQTTQMDDDNGILTEIDEANIVEGRPIRIRFNADVSAHVPWRFSPLQSEIVVLPGETALAFYVAKNLSDSPITGIATYNITPAKAAIYFNKVQCFCFDEQRLKPGEGLDMPVFFYIDPEFAHDSNMDDVKDIVLSYTFFRAEDVTPEQLQKAQAVAMGQ